MKLPRAIWIDLWFLPFQRALEFTFNHWGRVEINHSKKVIAIKLMGKGSLIRLFSLCQEFSADIDQLFVITFEEQRDVCELFEIRNVHFIRTKKLGHFVTDCWNGLKTARKISPGAVVSLERCSFAVNSFGLLLSMYSRSKNFFFEAAHRAKSEKIIAQNANELSLKEILNTCVQLLPKSNEATKCKSIAINRNNVLININASELLPERRYPVQHFINLIQHLHSYNKEWEFILTGSSSEMNYVEVLVKALQGIPVVNTAGKWSLVKLVDEMMRSSLIITGDSMPLHLAAYLQIPVLVLWGPTQPMHFGYNHHQTIHSISLNLECSPCFLHPRSQVAAHCRGRIDCLTNLNPLQVAEASQKIMMEQKAERIVNVPRGWNENYQVKRLN